MHSVFVLVVMRVFLFLLQIAIIQYGEMKIKKREAIINRVAKK